MSGIVSIDRSDIENMDKRYRIHFVNSLTGFKPLNLVGTASEAGSTNLSIISSVVHLGSHPPLFGFVLRPDVSPRHTLLNIRETGECTLNHVGLPFYQRAHQTSARYPREVSEFKMCGFTEQQYEGCKAPFVKEAKIKLALTILEEKRIEQNGTHFLIGEIKKVFLPEGIISDDGFIDLAATETICGAGLDCYLETKPLARLSYAKPDRELIQID